MGGEQQGLLSDPTVGPSNQAQVDAMRQILGLGGGALMLGATGRGLVGLNNFLGRNLG